MIEIVVENRTFQGFVKIEVMAHYKLLPNYFEATFRFDDFEPLKINQNYILFISNEIYQQGIITDIQLHVSRKYGKLYVVRGVDNNNYLLNNSCGLYNYQILYSEIPTTQSAKKILEFFKIKNSFEVPDKNLFILPNTTDSLWSVVKKIAQNTNSNAISNGNIIRFVNKFDKKINASLINDSVNPESNNIFSAELNFNFTNKVKNITTIGVNGLLNIVNTNNNINNKNNDIFIRDYLFNKDLTLYSKNTREVNNYNIIEYNCNIKTHDLNGEIPLINSIISVFDNEYNVDTDLLITSLHFTESRADGLELDLTLIDPAILNSNFPKGFLGNKFLEV